MATITGPSDAEPTGQLLDAIPRRNPEGAREELLVFLEEFEGNPYLSLQLWVEDGTEGRWWPVRSRLSIRLSEVDRLTKALVKGVRAARGPAVKTDDQEERRRHNRALMGRAMERIRRREAIRESLQQSAPSSKRGAAPNVIATKSAEPSAQGDETRTESDSTRGCPFEPGSYRISNETGRDRGR